LKHIKERVEIVKSIEEGVEIVDRDYDALLLFSGGKNEER